MGMEILRTESLTKVRDGQFAEMIDTKLAAMYQDCVDRPLLKKARKLTIEITIAPTGEDDPLETVDTEFSVKSMTPKSAFLESVQSLLSGGRKQLTNPSKGNEDIIVLNYVSGEIERHEWPQSELLDFVRKRTR